MLVILFYIHRNQFMPSIMNLLIHVLQQAISISAWPYLQGAIPE